MRYLSLTSRNMKEIFRDPVAFLLGLLLPFGLISLFLTLGKKFPVDLFEARTFTPAIITFSFSFLIMFSSVLLSKDRQSAFLTRLLTTPLKPVDFIAAYVLPFLPLAFLQIVICFTVGQIAGAGFTLLNMIPALVVFLFMAFACIGVGMIMGSLLTESQISGVGAIMINAIGLLGGIWLDLKMIGGLFESIGNALPFVHAVNASRALLNGASFGDVFIDFLWVLGYSVILFVLGVVSFRWKTKG